MSATIASLLALLFGFGVMQMGNTLQGYAAECPGRR
jgi:hypothetical protein